MSGKIPSLFRGGGDAKTAAETAKTAAETAQTAAETALDSFDDRYLGAKSSNPTLDNDGNALIDGALYFNTTSNIMRVYDLGNTTWLDLNITGTNLTNVNTVAGAISNVNNVGGSIANVNTVASNINNVNTVAADIAKVVTVANDLNETVSEIEVAAADLQETTSEIDTVANSITNVDLVGNNISNINALGQVLAGQTTYTVTVQAVGGPNYFFIDGVQAPTLNLTPELPEVVSSDAAAPTLPVVERLLGPPLHEPNETLPGTAYLSAGES